MAYNGTIDLISGIRPKNGGTFPLVDAKDVRVDDGTRLDGILNSISLKAAQNVDVLPSAGEDNHLCLRTVLENGTERLFINLLKDSTYQWFEFGLGTSSSDTAVLGTGIIGTMVLGKE